MCRPSNVLASNRICLASSTPFVGVVVVDVVVVFIVELHKTLAAICFYHSDKQRTYLPDAKILFFLQFSAAISSADTHSLTRSFASHAANKLTDVLAEQRHHT